MFGKKIIQAAAFAGTLLAGAAQAAPVHVDYGFVPFGGNVSFEGATLGSATSIDLSSIALYITNTVSPDDASGVAITDLISPIFGFAAPVAFSKGVNDISGLGFSKTWDTTGSTSCGGGADMTACTQLGIYSATFTQLVVSSSGANNLRWILRGTVTLPDGSVQDDFLSASFTDAGNTVNVSFAETSTNPVPAPAILGLMGLGLMGLGFARRAKA